MDQIEAGLRPQQRSLDFIQARRWATKTEEKDYEQTWVDLLNHEYGENLLESIELLSKRGLRLQNERQKRAHRTIQLALQRASEIQFFHWELAFPTVWSEAGTAGRFGGFDAVIGNPPWDRMKLQEVEWFAERKPEIAKAVRAADRKAMIVALEKANDPLWEEYVSARNLSDRAIRVARDCGDYPLLSSGDVNLYSLFVERAASLIHPRGMVGLLTPSGIAADKSAAQFFGDITANGRLAALFDALRASTEIAGSIRTQPKPDGPTAMPARISTTTAGMRRRPGTVAVSSGAARAMALTTSRPSKEMAGIGGLLSRCSVRGRPSGGGIRYAPP